MVMQRVGGLRGARWSDNPAVRGSRDPGNTVLHYGAGVEAPQFSLSPGEAFIPKNYDRPLRAEGYVERPYGRQIAETGRVLAPERQLGMPQMRLRGLDARVGDAPAAKKRVGRNLENAIPRLLAGEVDSVTLPDVWLPGNNRQTTLTRADFLRGATGEQVEQRLAELSSLLGEAFPVRVPRSAEQAEAQALLRGKLDRRTGLPEHEPPHLRGAQGALVAEDAAFNADVGGYRGEDPASVSDWTKSTPELHPYGKAAVVEIGPGGVPRVAEYEVGGTYETVDREPDSTAAFLREKPVSIGQAVQDAMDAAKTPMVRSLQLKRMGFVPLEVPEGNMIGHVPGAGGEDAIPVYRTNTEGNFRIGHPTNRSEADLRAGAAQVLKVGHEMRWAPDTEMTIGAGGLAGGLQRGFTFSLGNELGGSMPLLDIRDKRGAQEYIRMLTGQRADGLGPDGFLAREPVYAMDSTGRPVQALMPQIVDGRATGHLLPMKRQEEWAGPAVLMPGSDKATVTARKDAEAWGKSVGLENTSLERVLGSEIGAGSFMADPSMAPGDAIADALIRGTVSVDMLDRDPYFRRVFRPGSYERTMLNQNVISRSGGKVRPPFPAEERVLQGDLGIVAPYAVEPIPGAPVERFRTNPAWGSGGSALQEEATAALFGAPTDSARVPSGPRAVATTPPAPPAPAYGSYVVDPDWQMRLAGVAEELPNRYAPGVLTDVADYMMSGRGARQPVAGQEAVRGASGLRENDRFYLFNPDGSPKGSGTVPVLSSPSASAPAAYEQLELGISVPPGPDASVPRLGEEVRSYMDEIPVGRPAGPYDSRPYYGTGDLSVYRQAATPAGAMRGFDYGRMANDLGLDVPVVTGVEMLDDGRKRVLTRDERAAAEAQSAAAARAHELAMAQMAMRIRHRRENPPPSPRFARPEPEQRGFLSRRRGTEDYYPSSPLY
jgi:hypothetical protein